MQFAMEHLMEVEEVHEEFDAVVVHGKTLLELQLKDWDAILSKPEV